MNDKLKEDFSIDWEDDRYVSRREFFKFMTLASGGLAAGSAALAAWPSIRGAKSIVSQRQLIAKASDLAPGGSLGFNYPGKDDLCLLVRKPNGELVAYSRRCTHLSCPVQYQAEKSRLYCPCHNGAFSLADGSPTQGPPSHPLKKIAIEVVGDDIFATGVQQ